MNQLCSENWYCPGIPPALAKFTGIIKPAYRMPAFAAAASRSFARREAEQKEALAQGVGEERLRRSWAGDRRTGGSRGLSVLRRRALRLRVFWSAMDRVWSLRPDKVR